MPNDRIRLSPKEGILPPLTVSGRQTSTWDDAYHFILGASWTRFLLLASAAYLALNALFACIYLLAPGSIAHAREGSFEDAFFFSVQTMATIGYGGMMPATRLGHIFVTTEALIGILFTTLLTGLAFAKFARPSARVLFANRVVIAPRDGVPHLMFRLANWRHNLVVEAQLRVTLLRTHTTREGETMRIPTEIRLVRDRTALFAMSWLPMHLIDETSPFYGPHAIRDLIAERAEIYLSFTGLDETVAQTIHARKRYPLTDIVENARFADVLHIGEDGSRHIDYAHFHEVVPVTTKSE
jgi:inward rectifier potassium channel